MRLPLGAGYLSDQVIADASRLGTKLLESIGIPQWKTGGFPIAGRVID